MRTYQPLGIYSGRLHEHPTYDHPHVRRLAPTGRATLAAAPTRPPPAPTDTLVLAFD